MVTMTSAQRAEARGGRSPPRLRLTPRPQYRAQQLPPAWPPPARRAPAPRARGRARATPTPAPAPAPGALGRALHQEGAGSNSWCLEGPRSARTAFQASRPRSVREVRAGGGRMGPGAQGFGDPLHGCHCPAAPWGSSSQSYPAFELGG